MYVDSHKEAPNWVTVERGSRGGLFYEIGFYDLPEVIREAVYDIGDRIREIMAESLQEATESANEGRVQVNLDTYTLDVARPQVKEELESQLDNQIPFTPEVYREVVGVIMETFLDRIT